MGVPVRLGPRRELGVDFWEQAHREARGDDGVDEVVDAKCGQDFVDVEREGAEGEGFGDGLRGFDGDIRGRKRVFHFVGRRGG